MASAAPPLSAPFILRQQHSSNPTRTQREWKLQRTSHRLPAPSQSLSQDLTNATRASSLFNDKTNVDHDQIEAAREEWGLPSLPASSSPSTSNSARPSCSITWDENSVKASCSYLQHDTVEAASTPSRSACSLDHWDYSISFSPFVSNSLPSIDLKSLRSNKRSHPSKGYDPQLGRVLVIGREDGTVSVYRAFGRLEDQPAPPSDASPDISISLASASDSRRSSMVSDTSRLRSPDLERSSINLSSSRRMHGREPSPLLSSFSHDRSYNSLAAMSTVSTASSHTHHSNVVVSVQVEEALPATSIESNVSAKGQTSSNNAKDAEHQLEAQIAAAERNDHHHGMIGGVIEKLGLSSHNHNHHHRPPPSRHSTSSSTSPRDPASPTASVIPNAHADSTSRPSAPTASKAIGHKDTTASDQPRDPSSFAADNAATHARGITSSSSQSWPPEARHGAFHPLYSIATRDRSPVVALRIVPISSSQSACESDRTGLLVVQEQGCVSLWSLFDGNQLWQTDLATAKAAPPEQQEGVVVAGAAAGRLVNQAPSMFQTLSSQLPHSASSPLTRSPAGSIRGASQPASVRTRTGAKVPINASRINESIGVIISSTVQTFRSLHRNFAMLWDAFSPSALFLDLQDGIVVYKETLDDVFPTNVPALWRNPNSGLSLTWFDASRKLQRIELGYSAFSEHTSDGKKELAEHSLAATPSWSLLEGESVHQALFRQEKILTISSNTLKSYDLTTGTLQASHSISIGTIHEVVAATSEPDVLMIRTLNGIAKVVLGTTESPIVFPGLPQAEAYLAWRDMNGTLLDKIFVLMPSQSKKPSCSIAAWDANSQEVEEMSLSERDVLASVPPAADCQVTCILPISLERIVVALNGGLGILPLTSLSAGSLSASARPGNSIGMDKEICILRVASSPRAGNKCIVGATRQGDLAFWDATSLDLEACFSLSASPIETLITFGDEDNTIRLHGCVACVSSDSSVTMVLLDGFKMLYTIPGRGSKLQSLAVRADEILLTYDDGKARVWDLRTQELRRSIAIDQAQVLVEDGKGWWSIKEVEPYNPMHSGTSGVLSQLASARDVFSASVLVDFRRAIEAAARMARPAAGTARGSTTDPDAAGEEEEDNLTISLGSPAARKAINIIRPLLSVVFPWRLDEQLDKKLIVLLDLDATSFSAGTSFSMGLYSMSDSLLLPSEASELPTAAWTLNGRLTTVRALVCSAMLRVLTRVQELRGVAQELARFVEEDLVATVGNGCKDTSLGLLSTYLLDKNMNLQESSRALLKSALSRLDESGLEKLCEEWQPRLPFNQSGVVSDDKTPNALMLLGTVAVDRFKYMNPKLLKEIAMSIKMFLDEADNGESGSNNSSQDGRRQAIAIELCRTGFSIWQHYFDAAEIVRSLFALSTNKESTLTTTTSTSGGVSGAENRTLARKATLQIASENTPLFMTTLSLDILHARSAAHCAATMRLVAFMVRRRPMVLLPNLPRLCEAVVKSLDPTVTEMREAVVHAATVMIGELVSTYPTIDFYGRGQKLAVGTDVGAVLMYDLKTATRLYVIEGHRGALNGCSFSPDGRRLVTVSLEEKKLLIWKTGSGISSFFTPGSMPRQGGTDGSGAYRAIDFNVGEAADSYFSSHESSSASANAKTGPPKTALNYLRFEWNNERSLCVHIGHAQLNLSVD